jgi:protein-S-isoprenylcysteine O-methyltransferase Ste14
VLALASGYPKAMVAALATLLVFAQQGQGNSETTSSGVGIAIIIGVVIAAVLVIGAVWTFAARRGSRVPKNRPDHRRHAGRS